MAVFGVNGSGWYRAIVMPLVMPLVLRAEEAPFDMLEYNRCHTLTLVGSLL